DKLSAAMQVAKRVYSLAQEQNDSALLIGAHRSLAATLYWLGDFETARQYAMHGVQIWRSKDVQSPVEEVHAPVVSCLCYETVSEWHLGDIASCQATIAESISLAKKLNDTNALALALENAAILASFERNPAEVERFASDLIQLSTRHNFSHFLAVGAIYRGWARSASGDTAGGIPWIEQGLRVFRAVGAALTLPYFLELKAEALHLEDRTSEALEEINEAEALAERFEQHYCFAELHRLRGVFLA